MRDKPPVSGWRTLAIAAARRLRFAAIALLAPLAFQVVGGSAQASEAQVGAPDISPFVAREITPKIHLLTTPKDWYAFAIGNVILIEQSDGFVIVDSGMTAAHGRAVVAYLRSISSKPVKAVAITHWHNDHPQGVSAIRDAFPKVRIIATTGTEAGMRGPESFDIGYAPNPLADAATRKRVEDAEAGYKKLLDDPATDEARKGRIRKALGQFDQYLAGFGGSYIVLPTETFDRRLVIADRDNPVELLFLGRANTAGDLVAWAPKERVVASGDIVVSPIPFGFGSYPEDWLTTLARLRQLDFKVLIPGHGEPQFDRSYLDKLSVAIQDIRRQVGPLARAGLPLEAVRKRVDFTQTAKPFASTERDRAAFTGLFAEPMTESAYKEALHKPIVQGSDSIKPSFSEPPPPKRSLHHRR